MPQEPYDLQEDMKLICQFNRKRMTNETHKISRKIIEQVGYCEICGFNFKPILQIHHILPLSELGTNDRDNIICVCPNCHKLLNYRYTMTHNQIQMDDTYFDYDTREKLDEVIVKRDIKHMHSMMSLIKFRFGTKENK